MQNFIKKFLFTLFATNFLLLSTTIYTIAATGHWEIKNSSNNSMISSKDWVSIAISSDSSKLAATEQSTNGIWTSNDSGVSWINQTLASSSMSNQFWGPIVMSAEGNKLATVVSYGDIWTSNDSGASWTNVTSGTSASGQGWLTIAMNSNGSKLIAGEQSNGDIWTSNDSGASWTNVTSGTSASGQEWNSITMSSDGNKAAAVVGGGDIWTSNDSGASWTNVTSASPSMSGESWQSITMSSDGTKLAAVTSYNGDIWTSNDSGVSWTNVTSGTPASGQMWFSVTMNSDGTNISAAVLGGDIWTSNDSGASWTNVTSGTLATQSWYSIRSNTSGNKLAAVVQGGDIWTLDYIEDQTPSSTSNLINQSSNNGVIPLEFLQKINQQNLQLVNQNCNITINNVTTPCSLSNNSNNINNSINKETTAATSFNFNRDLKLEMTGDDVKTLQHYLNISGYTVSLTGPGSINNETNYFGLLTKQALIKYQLDNNIKPSIGYFGPITRNSIQINNNPLYQSQSNSKVNPLFE